MSEERAWYDNSDWYDEDLSAQEMYDILFERYDCQWGKMLPLLREVLEAYQRLKSKLPRWVSVEEELPGEDLEEYLYVLLDTGEVDTFWYGGSEGWDHPSPARYIDGIKITHWLKFELPEVPE